MHSATRRSVRAQELRVSPVASKVLMCDLAWSISSCSEGCPHVEHGLRAAGILCKRQSASGARLMSSVTMPHSRVQQRSLSLTSTAKGLSTPSSRPILRLRWHACCSLCISCPAAAVLCKCANSNLMWLSCLLWCWLQPSQLPTPSRRYHVQCP